MPRKEGGSDRNFDESSAQQQSRGAVVQLSNVALQLTSWAPSSTPPSSAGRQPPLPRLLRVAGNGRGAVVVLPFADLPSDAGAADILCFFQASRRSCRRTSNSPFPKSEEAATSLRWETPKKAGSSARGKARGTILYQGRFRVRDPKRKAQATRIPNCWPRPRSHAPDPKTGAHCWHLMPNRWPTEPRGYGGWEASDGICCQKKEAAVFGAPISVNTYR